MYGLAITTLDEFGAASTYIEYAEDQQLAVERMNWIAEDAEKHGWRVLNSSYWAIWLQEYVNGMPRQKAFLQVAPLRKIKI